MPRSRGGSDRPDNLVAACHDCNRRKGNLTATEYGHPEVAKGVKRSLRAAAHTQAGKTATWEALTEIAPVEVTYSERETGRTWGPAWSGRCLASGNGTRLRCRMGGSGLLKGGGRAGTLPCRIWTAT